LYNRTAEEFQIRQEKTWRFDMKNRIGVLVFGSFVLFTMLIPPTFAHHGNAAYEKRTVIVKGVVTEWRWTNPHSFLKFDAKDEKGNLVHWTGEWNAPSTLVNFGITAKSFKVGEEVTVIMDGMAKSGANLGRVIKVVLPTGQELSMGDER
jgi:Family of unknown function (DUF6152)